jgi:hypothetical protein
VRRAAAFAAALFLVGCTWDAPPVTAPLAAQQCVPKRTWTRAEQTALADALASVPPDSILFVLESDWQRMRDNPNTCK